ncbi:hypothetical protein F5B22DRAFT_46224, partial [Xylaria bambusicola]|uniref:uncharacterized protein n=1 Tax=Xylaria bambusicola TaxID=326684 RepID=UPI002008A568
MLEILRRIRKMDEVGVVTRKEGDSERRAWNICTLWAIRYGMKFAAEKSELLHFLRNGTYTASLNLSGATIKLAESVRFFGVHFTGRLRWGKHLAALRKKLTVQQY